MFSRSLRIRLIIVSTVISCIVIAAAVRSGRVSEAQKTPVAVSVTATDTVTDVAGTVDGNADPGDTLEYTVVATNGGSTDATGVALSSTLPSINTFVGGSTAISPVAQNDTYPQTVIGNVSINSANIPYSVVTNDFIG